MEIIAGIVAVVLVGLLFISVGLNFWVAPIFRRRSAAERQRGRLRDSHQRMTRELEALAEQKRLINERFVMVKDRVSALRLDPLQKALDAYLEQEIDAVAEASKLPLGWPDNVIDLKADTEADLETSAQAWQKCHDSLTVGQKLLEELKGILASFREVESQLTKFQEKSAAVDKRLTELAKQGHRLDAYRQLWQSSQELADQSRESLKKGAYKQALSRAEEAIAILDQQITAKVDQALKLQAEATKAVADLRPRLLSLRDQIETVSRTQLTRAKTQYSPENWQPAEEFLTQALTYVQGCLSGMAELDGQISMERQEWQSALDAAKTVSSEIQGLSESLKQVTDQFAAWATFKDTLSSALEKAQSEVDELWPYMVRNFADIPNGLYQTLVEEECNIVRNRNVLREGSMELYRLGNQAARSIKAIKGIDVTARHDHDLRAQARARKLN